MSDLASLTGLPGLQDLVLWMRDPAIASTGLVALAFSGLTLQAWLFRGLRHWLSTRSGPEWFVDAASLLVQGLGIPVLQTWLVVNGLGPMLPGLAGCWTLPPWAVFLVAFVGVDYAYYWNHRLLHAPGLWPIHRLHHTSRELDVWATSRNTLWTSLCIVYLWLFGVLVFLTGHESAVLWAAAVSSVLDLWRHGGHQPPAPLSRWLGTLLVLPADHAWHHAREEVHVNFGANLNVWDRIHGTFHRSPAPPSSLGAELPGPLLRHLIWPYS